MAAALSGPVAWSLQLWLVYLAVEAACRKDVLAGEAGGLPVVGLVVAAVSLAAAAAAAWGGLTAYRAWREVDEAPGGAWDAHGHAGDSGDTDAGTGIGTAPHRGERRAFMARAGVFLAALFLLLIAFTAAPPLVVPVCG